MIFPWQNKQWQTLWHAVSSHRLPHALLLSGLAGLGKALFAEHLMRSLLCANVSDDGMFCSVCHACRLVEGGTHPNVMRVVPDGAAIKIDQIREINEFLQLSALQGLYRIVMIDSAASMNINAANALLKTLEEPTAYALIILISDSDRMPVTIKSRCQRITFAAPQRALALTWLKSKLPRSALNDAHLLLSLTHGAPLAALNLAQESKALNLRRELITIFNSLSQNAIDPIQSASKIQTIDVRIMIDTAISWLMDFLRLKWGEDEERLMNHDRSQEMKAITERKQIQTQNKDMQFIQLMGDLQKLRMYLCQGMNLNKQLLIENIFIRWAECF